MRSQPTLTTTRLDLRPIRSSDVDALWALWTDRDVRRFLWDDRVITREEATATVEECLSLSGMGLGLWLLDDRSGDRPSPGPTPVPIGCAGLLPVSTAAEHDARLAGLVEPLVALAPDVWGRGYAHEALTALLAYASTTLALSRLAGVTDVPNVASDRMLRRAGCSVLGETSGPRYPLRTYLWEAAGTKAETPR